MTEEEKADLEQVRANAKLRCREVYGTIKLLEKTLSTYYKDHYRWLERFKKADYELAVEEKLHKVSISKKSRARPKLEMKLTKEQILSIADELGIRVELDFG